MKLFKRNQCGEPVNLLVITSFCVTMAICAGFCYLGFYQSQLLGWICLAVCLWGWQIVNALVLNLFCPLNRGNGSVTTDSHEIVSDPDLAKLIGRSGSTTTSLRPSGYIVVDGLRYDAIATGEFIERDTPVRVSAIKHKCLVVDKISQSGS